MVSDRITFGGLASGLDTNMIIEAVLAAERRPVALAETRRAGIEARQDALSSVAKSLSSLLSATKPLTRPSTFRTRLTSVLADTENSGRVTATATSDAAVGSFKVNVLSLASATRVSSSDFVGQAVDAGAALDQAGFATPVTAGTFTINDTAFTIEAATATSIVSSAALGAAVDASVTLDSAGLDLAPVSGTFNINGTAISFDAATDSLNDLVSRINSSAADVTASYDATARTLTLSNDTTGPGAITLSDTSGNFLEAMKLIDGTGATIGSETAGTDMISLNDLISEINASGIGVTASIVNDAGGRPNLLQISDDAGTDNVRLGAGGDTSNFLSASRLLASPAGTARTSTSGLGGVDVTTDLVDARLATALSSSTGSFTINGVSISYDESADSMSNVISRINQSSAGVTASYDSVNDRLVLAANAQGSSSIQLNDDSGNFLAATGVLNATQAMGTSASYTIDGGATRYSSSNTVTDAVSGVTLTLHDTTTSAVTVEVKADYSGAEKAIQAFVTQYNKSAELMRALTRYDEDGENGVLFGDSTLRLAERNLRSKIISPVTGFSGSVRTLSDVGISFGAVGSAVGTTDELVFDAAKLRERLQSDPATVERLFHAFSGTVTLDAGGTGSIASISGTPSTATKPGTYTVTSTTSGSLSLTFTPSDGSTPISSTGTITAGGTNTSLIPGVTLTAAGTLVDGTDTITLDAAEQGVARNLESYIDALTRVGGTFDTRDRELRTTIEDINDRIDRLEDRIEAREEQLIRKYTALEQTIQRLQQQQQALTSMVSQLGLSGRSKSQ